MIAAIDFSITPTAIVTLIATGIPLVVAIAVRRTASATTKVLINAVGTAGLSAVALWLAAPKANLSNFFLTWALAFVVSGAAHSHLWKPLGISEMVTTATAGYGVGGTTQEVKDDVIEVTAPDTSEEPVTDTEPEPEPEPEAPDPEELEDAVAVEVAADEVTISKELGLLDDDDEIVDTPADANAEHGENTEEDKVVDEAPENPEET